MSRLSRIWLLWIAGCVFLTVGAATPVIQRSATLPNGMRITCIEVHENPVIASTVLVRVGLSHETAAINGVSHLLEHLTFNGTTSRSQEQFYRDLDRSGCYCNASTSDDYTAYYLLTPTSMFSKGLALQADMLLRAAIPEDKIEKEKKIVLEEIRKDRGRRGYDAESAVRSFLYQGTPYAMRVIGSADSVKRIPRKEIVAFYRKWYRPENMEMLIVGDTTLEQVQPLVTRLFGAIPATGSGTQVAPVQIHAASGIQVLNGGSLPMPELRMVFDVNPLRKRYEELALFTDVLDRDLKQQFSDIDPRIGADLNLSAATATLVVTIHLSSKASRSSVQPIRDRILKMISSETIAAVELAALVRKRRVDDLYALERPHFFGMLAAPSMAAGTFRGVQRPPVSTEKIHELGSGIAGLRRADLMLLPGGEK